MAIKATAVSFLIRLSVVAGVWVGVAVVGCGCPGAGTAAPVAEAAQAAAVEVCESGK